MVEKPPRYFALAVLPCNSSEFMYVQPVHAAFCVDNPQTAHLIISLSSWLALPFISTTSSVIRTLAGRAVPEVLLQSNFA
jgi:hypothetical protein